MIPITNYYSKEYLKQDSIANIGTITYFKNFAYLSIQEGVHLGFIEMEKIQSLITYHFNKNPYAYMCNRNVSYSVNPISYRSLTNIDELKCIAIIKEFKCSHDIEVEKHFIKKPLEVFQTFEEASEWVNTMIIKK